MVYQLHNKGVSVSILTAALIALATADAAAAPCSPDVSPTANCTDLTVNNPNLSITVPTGITVTSSTSSLSNNTVHTSLFNNGVLAGQVAGIDDNFTESFDTIVNNGTIRSTGMFGIYSESGSSISSLTNNGTIDGETYAGINNDNATIGVLTNTGTIITGTTGNAGILNSGTIGTLNNKQGVGNTAGGLTYGGVLPTNYNVIIASPSSYGQFNGTYGVTGTTHFGIYNGSTVTQGTYRSVLTGIAPSNLAATSGIYSGFNWTLNEIGATDVYDLQVAFSPAGLAAEQQSVQSLSDSQHATLIQERSTANELLGFTRPIEDGDYVFAGGMFGSAVGYAGGQGSKRGVTVLGGIAYGSQDYGDEVVQKAATTIAAAARYTFDDFFADEGHRLHPYGEIGGWVTPDSTLNMSRAYNLGGTSSVGTGSTNSTDWDYYLRLGVTADLDTDNKLTGFGEVGEQAMDFGGYAEGSSANNPTPATVNAGELSMGVLRAGGAWTHKVGDLPFGDGDDMHVVPIEVTLSGAIAHSFDAHSGLTVNAGGVGFSAADTTDTWGEYGARIEGHVTQNATIGIDMLGTVGGGALGNSTHAGISLGYKF